MSHEIPFSDTQSLPPEPLPPIRFVPYLRPQIWGSTAFQSRFGRENTDNHSRIGESWELSPLHEHVSCVAEGPLNGISINDLWSNADPVIFGRPFKSELFPWLIKWLDCSDWLSIQVHPNESQATPPFSKGKSEAWIVVEASAQAEVRVGLRPGITRDRFVASLQDGTVIDCLNVFQPKIGDAFYLPAGTVHTARGVVMAEVQQPSDATYRLFDWNRIDASGALRPLHRELGLDAIDWNQPTQNRLIPVNLNECTSGVHRELLLDSSWVRLERIRIEECVPGNVMQPNEVSFWMVLDGGIEISDPRFSTDLNFPCGSSFLLPVGTTPAIWKRIRGGPSPSLLCIRPGSD